MGADGGLAWVYLKDETQETRNKFRNLVSDLGILVWEDYNDEYNKPWLEDHPLTSNAVITTYGTNQISQGTDDLRDMLREILDFETPPDSPWKPDWTFREVITNLYTENPSQARSWKSTTEMVIGYGLGCGWCDYLSGTWSHIEDPEKLTPSPLWDMTLEDGLRK
jgi:hypothetical protein